MDAGNSVNIKVLFERYFLYPHSNKSELENAYERRPNFLVVIDIHEVLLQCRQLPFALRQRPGREVIHLTNGALELPLMWHMSFEHQKL